MAVIPEKVPHQPGTEQVDRQQQGGACHAENAAQEPENKAGPGVAAKAQSLLRFLGRQLSLTV